MCHAKVSLYTRVRDGFYLVALIVSLAYVIVCAHTQRMPIFAFARINDDENGEWK